MSQNKANQLTLEVGCLRSSARAGFIDDFGTSCDCTFHSGRGVTIGGFGVDDEAVTATPVVARWTPPPR